MYSILLVDDEPDLLAAWHLILSEEGYHVCRAQNGLDALGCLTQHRPDLVITDWLMPLMNGAELCRRMRAHPDLAHVPILVHSSVLLPSDVDQVWDSCLRKPVHVPLFLTTVGKLCQRAESGANLSASCSTEHADRLANRESGA
jgi:CheY-like chemotaxis protein